MFDHLDTLDDTTPPTPDDAMLRRVHGRADRLRRRTRVSAIAAGVSVLAVAAGVIAVTRNQNHSVSVVTPPSTSITTPAPTTTKPNPAKYFVVGRLPNGLTVRMNLATETVQLGDDIHVAAVVTNNTFKTQTIGQGPIQCVLEQGLVLRDTQGNDVADGRENVGCYDIARSLARNQTITVPASLSTASVRLAAGASQGRFELRLEDERRLPRDPPAEGSIGPIPIFVRAPDVTARLIVPLTEVHPSGTILGTLELDNHGPAVHVACNGPSYLIGLSVNGELIEPGQGLVGQTGGCRNRPATDVIPTGISRYPFSVYAQYDSCTSAGRATASEPACGSPPMIPPLPAGRYEIRFVGTGPLHSVTALPARIEVIPFGPSAPSSSTPGR